MNPWDRLKALVRPPVDWVAGLRVVTGKQRRQARADLRYYVHQADKAHAAKREAERLLVLLSEPLKEWDLADFPEPSYIRLQASYEDFHTLALDADDALRLADVLDAYRLTATAVAPLRMGRVVEDQAKRMGWDDEPLTTARRRPLDPRRLP